MARRQSKHTLTGSRIYIRRGKYALFCATATENPATGRVLKWHNLCPIADGELRARIMAAAIISQANPNHAGGDLPEHMERYRLECLKRRELHRPKEHAREVIFDEGTKEFSRECGVIAKTFEAFNIDQPLGVDIARFVDFWQGRRMAQIYLSRLSEFFRWAIRRGLRHDNPCQNIRVEKPPKRSRYLTDAEWHAARDALLLGADNKPTASGSMAQCYVDLCFLLYQRTTEIRLLKWSQIDMQAGMIFFTPTKTERSSGASVAVPISPAVKAVLERSRQVGTVKGLYVIHSRTGQAYTANGIGTAWRRACARAGVEDATLKDIRAKAATDAKRAGYSRAQIRVGLAHADEGMTQHYLKGRDADRSELMLELPRRQA